MHYLLLLALSLSTTLAWSQEELPTEEESVEVEQKFTTTDLVQICTVPLPVSKYKTVNRMLVNTKHVYLKVNRKTYGTPFTIKQTYMGGDAYLYTEDIFRKANIDYEVCYNVRHKAEETSEAFAKRTACIANRLAVQEKHKPENAERWFPVFDYHFMSNNCGSMVNYLLSCSGGQTIRKTINYSVGDKVEAEKEAKIGDVSSGQLEMIPSTYGEICEKALTECEVEETETNS